MILDQLNERRPLPLGRKEFDTFADRIIKGAMIQGDEKTHPDDFYDSQKCVVASLILHLGPTESAKEDAFFIHSLRKLASNQVAHTIAEELRGKLKEKIKAREDAEKAAVEAARQDVEKTIAAKAAKPEDPGLTVVK